MAINICMNEQKQGLSSIAKRVRGVAAMTDLFCNCMWSIVSLVPMHLLVLWVGSEQRLAALLLSMCGF
jgi:hypothetical protein